MRRKVRNTVIGCKFDNATATVRLSMPPARLELLLVVLGIAAFAISTAVSASDPGPESGPRLDAIERSRAEGPRLAEECRQLTEEAARLYALRAEVEALESGGNFYMRKINLPGSSALVHDRIQEFKRDIRAMQDANPGDPAIVQLKEEHNRLYDSYVAQMNALIAGGDDVGLANLGVRNYDELVARYGRARNEWEPQQARYSRLLEEKDQVCEQSRRAEELIAAGLCEMFNRAALTPGRPGNATEVATLRSSAITDLFGISLAHAIGTAPGEIAAYARGAIGVVCVKRRAAASWNQLTLRDSVDVGDTVRTGWNGRVRLELTDRDEIANAGPSTLNLGPDTEVVIERFTISLQADERERHRREGLISLIQGEIRAFMKGWGSSSSVNVRAGTTICGIRGTEFVVTHAPESARVDLMVFDGSVELSTPQGSTLVGAGQMASTRGVTLDPVQALPDAARDRALAATEVGTTHDTTPAAAVASARGAVATGATAVVAPPAWNCVGRFGDCQTVIFAGSYYETVYRPGVNAEGSPVAEYFYPVLVDSTPVFQDGRQLWNSFARVHDGYPRAGFWHIEWRPEGGR